MKNNIKITLILMVMVISNIASARAISQDSLNKLMVLSGINKQIAEIPGLIHAGVQEVKKSNTALTDTHLGVIQKSVDDAFQTSVILNNLANVIRNNISEQEAKELLNWYKSGIGSVITKAEENASTPAAYHDMIKNAQTLLVDKERVQIAVKIDGLIKATDMALKLQKNTGIAVFTAVSNALNPGTPANINAYMSQLAAQEPQMRKNIEQLVILSYVYGYQNISLENMEKYIGFLSRTTTRKFNTALINGLTNSLNSSIEKMAKSLSVAFAENK